MPSSLPSKETAPNAALDEATEKSYQKLLTFLDLASGSAFAIARCNLPSLRKEILHRVSTDAAAKGVTVKEVDISSNYSRDFVAAVKTQLGGLSTGVRMAVMVNGIDGLIYQSASQENLLGEGRTPFIARLNFNRDRIARDLPFPIILWLESESLTVVLKQAPDFTQWISGHFHFGGPPAEAESLGQLIATYKSLPSQPVPVTHQQFEEISSLLQEVNATRGRGDALTLRKRLAPLIALGERYFWRSEFRAAREHWTEALEIARKLNNRRAESTALGNLGLACAALGETQSAIKFTAEQLMITREIGDRHSEGNALGNLGLTYAALGESRRAIDLYEQALAIRREMGDRQSEGDTLHNLGLAYFDLGEPRRAIEFYEKALEISGEIGDHQGEGNRLPNLGTALGNLGTAYAVLGETRRAIEFYEQALVIHCDVGDRRGEGAALCNLGLAYVDLGETPHAIKFYEKALEIAREIGDRRGEAGTLGNLGTAYRDLGDTRRAIELYEEAIQIDHEIGNRRGEGNALFNLGLAFDKLGEHAQAIDHAEAALKILEQIEDPKADRVRQQLAEWRKT